MENSAILRGSASKEEEGRRSDLPHVSAGLGSAFMCVCLKNKKSLQDVRRETAARRHQNTASDHDNAK